MRDIQLRTSDLSWRGVVDLIWDGSQCTPIRVNQRDLAVLPESLVETAWLSSGVRLAFRSDTSRIALTCAASSTGDGPPEFVLVVDGTEVSASQPVDGQLLFDGLAGKDSEVEIWFPHQARTSISSFSIEDDATLSASQKHQPKWIAYGSSITQSRFASSPTMTWVAQASRQLGLDVENRGYAGQCLLDPHIAMEIAAADFDVLSICTGINVHNLAAMSERVYRALLHGFLATIRADHDEPIVVVSPLASPSRETMPSYPRILPQTLRRVLGRTALSKRDGFTGPTLQDLRRATHEVVDCVRAEGDRNTHIIDGTTLLGVDQAELLSDGLHPSAAGESHVARQFIREFAEYAPVGSQTSG